MIVVGKDLPFEGVTTLTLDSSHNRNALSRQLLRELTDELTRADRDSSARVVLLRAEGPAFCSGGDLREALADGMEETSRLLVQVQRTIVGMGKPVVAQVHGPAQAGGIGIVAACDIVVAAESATFAFPEARLGMAPAVAGLTALSAMGRRAAAFRILTAATFSAVEAQAEGLVTVVCDDSELESTVAGILEAVIRCSAQGVRESKRVLAAPLLQHIDDLGVGAAEHVAGLFASPEMREAMSAFMARS